MTHTHLRFENLNPAARALAMDQLREQYLAQDRTLGNREEVLAAAHDEQTLLAYVRADLRTTRWQPTGTFCCEVGHDPLEERAFEAHLF